MLRNILSHYLLVEAEWVWSSEVVVQFSAFRLNDVRFPWRRRVVQSILLGMVILQHLLVQYCRVFLLNQALSRTFVAFHVSAVKLAHNLIEFVHFQIVFQTAPLSRAVSRSGFGCFQNTVKFSLDWCCLFFQLVVPKFILREFSSLNVCVKPFVFGLNKFLYWSLYWRASLVFVNFYHWGLCYLDGPASEGTSWLDCVSLNRLVFFWNSRGWNHTLRHFPSFFLLWLSSDWSDLFLRCRFLAYQGSYRLVFLVGFERVTGRLVDWKFALWTFTHRSGYIYWLAANFKHFRNNFRYLRLQSGLFSNLFYCAAVWGRKRYVVYQNVVCERSTLQWFVVLA